MYIYLCRTLLCLLFFVLLFFYSLLSHFLLFFFFFFNDTATTEIYTLSLHDALPISSRYSAEECLFTWWAATSCKARSEEHTSELQSLRHLVCRLLLEKKKKKTQPNTKQSKTHKDYHMTRTTPASNQTTSVNATNTKD